ncbi:MAG: hypothetical protein JKY98_12210 [Gammaproteobacteria bacterium]|nr:hypothetical protein [Gammaproteobacteria bacterium]
MSENGIEKIEPADFDISKSSLFSNEPAQPTKNKPSLLVWISLGFLAVIALAVIFVLPTLVTEYELPLERRVEVDQLTPRNPTANQQEINAVSPFDEAQKSLQRKEAQDVLAQLLGIQAELDIKAVEKWASQEYEDALEFARAGDESYLVQEFIEARDSYDEGLLALQAIQEQIPVAISQHLIDGEAALIANQSEGAVEKFSIVLNLQPDNSQAEIGLGRAEALDQVNTLLDQAGELMEAGELESARDLYLAALDLDDRNEITQSRLKQASAQILENEFAAIMSEGYELFQDEQPEGAIQSFQRAAALGIKQGQAEAAIQQTRDEVARVEIDRLRDDALNARDTEQWQEAVAAYASVLDIDGNLVFAQEGRDYTEKRLRLDQLLDYANANPERLADDEVYKQTLDIYYTGRGLEPPGAHLLEQLNQLQEFLDSSQVPLSVSLDSDNLTQVTLLRIGELGAFVSHTLSLKPGRYVAMGTREGYRDVREEFTVGFGQTPDSVVVKCDERIVATRGR